MSKQQDKIFLNLAGEFAVASELNRRRALASITYGASKAADIFVFNESMNRVLRVEVKTSDKGRWPLGEKVASPEEGVWWVFVLLPPPVEVLRFFVLSSQEVYDTWLPHHESFKSTYRKRHAGDEFKGLDVPNLTLPDVADHEGRWEEILDALHTK